MKESAQLTEEEGWQLTFRSRLRRLSATGDGIEGATAFTEKRKPQWKALLCYAPPLVGVGSSASSG